jgi:hypothetical protein
MEARTRTDSLIAELLDSTEIISGMMDSEEIELVIIEFERAREAGVPGDIVELGCNCGTTTTRERDGLGRLWMGHAAVSSEHAPTSLSTSRNPPRVRRCERCGGVRQIEGRAGS